MAAPHDLQLLLDLSGVSVVATDPEGRIQFWNQVAASTYGWSQQEALSKMARTLFCVQNPALDEAMRLFQENGQWQGEQQHRTKSGSQLTVHSRWTLVRDEEGRPTSVVIVSHDVSEQKKLESQFLRAQRLESIGTLASGIAHDLNNILTPILMSVGILRSRGLGMETEKLLNAIEGSAERGADIVRQVLTFARGVQGERMLLQPRHIISELSKILAQTFPRNISVRTQAAKDLWTLTGDATQIHQVLLNLCVNARDAMPNGGQLLIAAENVTISPYEAQLKEGASAGPRVVLKVTDTGEGIPQELLDHIFDPFFTTKEAGKGTGLGLATVRGIVKGHNGWVELETQPGNGTTFRVYLPATDTSDEAANEEKPEPPPRGNGETILVVDDEPAVRASAVQALSGHGYDVYTAEDGSDALAIYAQRRSQIALVLTDARMEMISGTELVKALRQLGATCKLIVSSGQCGPDERAVFQALGVRAFLDKPYSPERLLTVIHEALKVS